MAALSWSALTHSALRQYRMPVEITIRCDEMIAVDASYRQPWSDVLISFRAETEEDVREFDLTLIAQPTLERDIRIEHEKLAAQPSRDLAMVTRLQTILESLKAGNDYAVEPPSRGPIGNVYTSKEYIDRAVAEAMLRFLLETQGLTDVRFVWLTPRFPAATTGPWP